MAGIGAIGAALARSSSPSRTSSGRVARHVVGEPAAGVSLAGQEADGSIRLSERWRGACRSGASSSAFTSRRLLDSCAEDRNRSHKALYVVAAASLTFLASEVLVKLVRTHGPAIDPSLPTTTLTENLVRIVVVILGLLVILKGLGLDITPMLTALGVGGLAVALALQDTLANLFAGLYLTVAKHIRIGNYIKLSSGEEGYLVDIDWRASRLRQLTNNTVLVPNAKLSQSIVTNYHSPENELVGDDRGERRLRERSRPRRTDRDRGGARRDADGARAACRASSRSCGSTRSAIRASASP